jgi:hypothetical protein
MVIVMRMTTSKQARRIGEKAGAVPVYPIYKFNRSSLYYWNYRFDISKNFMYPFAYL